MFENLVEAVTEVFENLTDLIENLFKSAAETVRTLSARRQVYDFSTKGYGDAAGLPECNTSSIIRFDSAPIN
jgi:hypothetical protein